MTAFFNSLNGIEKTFLFFAIIGSVLFLIRTVLFFVGGADVDADIDADIDVGGDIDFAGDVDFDGEVDVSDVSHIDSSTSFHIFSLHGITGFFMMFGLVGLAMSKQSNLSPALAVAGGLVAGILTMWLVAKIFAGMKKLQADGTLKLTNAIGKDGTVYLTIPAGGTGKVQIVIQESLKIFDAVSEKKAEIKTGENVKVKKIISGNILVVDKI